MGCLRHPRRCRSILLLCAVTFLGGVAALFQGDHGIHEHRHIQDDASAEFVVSAEKLQDDWRFLHAYPAHYVARKLGADEHVTIDGSLDDDAWKDVPFTNTSFLDIAQPLFPDYQLPDQYSTKVKVRWDADFLYIGAYLGEPWVSPGSVHGSNAGLTSDLPISNSNVPYYDNDFEVFIDVSGTNYYYKEFEMNYNNATYDVLWRAPDGGLGSQGVPCCSDNSCDRWCQDSSWPPFHGKYSMYPNMKTATSKGDKGWSTEIAFPLRAKGSVGGLLSGGDNWERFDPNAGAQYWYADFSRAEHPFFTSNASDFAVLCPQIKKESPTLLGTDQWSCYWEWVWQPMSGHKYMHNPDNFGFLQFAKTTEDEALCGNVEWPARYVLAQVYQAEIAYVKDFGIYSTDLRPLLDDTYCSASNGCSREDLSKVLDTYKSAFNLVIDVLNTATTCVKYGQGADPTGGPCFTASVSMSLGETRVNGEINEGRYLDVRRSGPHACLDLSREVAAIQE